jgi:hypothetical protein
MSSIDVLIRYVFNFDQNVARIVSNLGELVKVQTLMPQTGQMKETVTLR